jgi:hypothetical protein
MIVRRATRLIAYACILAVLVVGGPAHANWRVYGSLDFGYSIGKGEASGSLDIGGDFSGSDQDVSPVLAGAIGIEMPLNEITPWAKPAKSSHLPAWALRFEVEAAFLREYELNTDGAAPPTFPFNTEAKSWSVMGNLWLDVPLAGLHKPIASVSGVIFRLPQLPRLKRFLEPASIYLGLGAGFTSFEIETSDSLYKGSSSEEEFAYQFGIGAGYQLTERVNLSAGYRYHRVNHANFDITDVGLGGDFSLRTSIHEARLSLRIRFANFPSPWR